MYFFLFQTVLFLFPVYIIMSLFLHISFLILGPGSPWPFPFSSPEAGEGGFVLCSSPSCHPNPGAWEPEPPAPVPALGAGDRGGKHERG